MALDPRDAYLSSYDYYLEPSFIAQTPAEPRHNARLMIVNRVDRHLVDTRHIKIWEWQDEISPDDLLILNDTKVLKARLRVRREGGGLGEILLLEPRQDGKWLCLARPAKRMRPGDNLWLEGLEQKSICLQVLGTDTHTGGRIIQFPCVYSNRENIESLLECYGEVPLPPYIQNFDANNIERYQTRYAAKPGAVAAPTAGLHLSDELLEALTQKGINFAYVTLHVGLGTFRPLEKEDLNDLELHKEWVEVKQDVIKAIDACKLRGGKVIAVGTTSVRALEGAFIAGGGTLKPFLGEVNLVIKPGYKFGVVQALLTNFHLPKSSLLLLVSALIGRERLLALYREAIRRQYRFFSYGDAMWISPEAVLPEAVIGREDYGS